MCNGVIKITDNLVNQLAPVFQERSTMLKKFYQLMMDNKDELAKMITAENVSKQTDKGHPVKCLNIQTPDEGGA